MNKLIFMVFLLILPALALAAEGSSLSFAPPPSDYSVVFLGNLFGVVDGVLSGTGSQIMGAMFSVFNSAVLALGGMIIMYTLMVSTMNTAHEGQMLGQKWSSIWIPVRSTIGLALLIPKASGYCLMQIFVMWIVVQGIGAADKVWEAALGYLNRGGVIIQAQTNPTDILTDSTKRAGLMSVNSGAASILEGQVCMLALQKQLESKRKAYLANKMKCSETSSPAMKEFCNTAVPDFLSSVNVVQVQNDDLSYTRSTGIPASNKFAVPMPYFKSGPYSALNKVCGEIKWNAISADKTGSLNSINSSGVGTVAVGGISITASQLETMQMSRAIAIQQMYMDLSAVAQVIVSNSPALSNSTATNVYAPNAKQQYGVPYTAAGNICTTYNEICSSWGPANNSTGVLFSGTEIQGAIADYYSIMNPTMNFLSSVAQSTNASNSRAFISKANSQGWIMAGSYFFDLVTLNGNAAQSGGSYDTDSGLSGSSGGLVADPCESGKNYSKICAWLGSEKDETIQPIKALIDGSYTTKRNGTIIADPTAKNPAQYLGSSSSSAVNPLDGVATEQSTGSSTVYGLVLNSMLVRQPGQPGVAPLEFANVIHFNVDPQNFYLKEQSFDCGKVKILFFSFCMGEMLGNLFYNTIFRYLYNSFLALFQQIINQVIMAFLMIPLQGMSDIFKQGLKTLTEPGANPIVALAKMGTNYINFSANLWFMLLSLAITSALIPFFGVFIFALISLAMPLLLAWIGVMVGVGFTTAYYIPILPYMIFTFGSLAWIISVIEAMVAAPIVALGVTHPEGHDAFGKGEAAVMILMNVFLRPSMMIIGYIAAIALSYVGVWLLNAGFDHAISFIQVGAPEQGGGCNTAWGQCADSWNQPFQSQTGSVNSNNSLATGGSGSGGYADWAGIYAFFFSILIYTMTYLTIVQKAFTLISVLPDKVLRWIGGNPESAGQESAQWGDEAKGKIGEAGKETSSAQGAIGNKLGGMGQKALGGAAKPGAKGKANAKGADKADSTKGGDGDGDGGGEPPIPPEAAAV